jgi:drug/metabolite transporter (DMT)-like permease
LKAQHPTLGIIFALSAAILFGLNASTTKVIIQAGISAETVVFIRALSAGLLALGWALVANRKALRLEKRLILPMLFMGVVGVGMLQWTYSIAVSLLPIGIALLFEYTAVLLVPIIALVFFKEKVKPQIWVGAALVLGGLAVVSQIWNGQLNPVGVLFAFAAAASLTTFFLMGERIQRYLPTNVVMTYGMGVAVLMFAPFTQFSDLSPALLAEPVSLQGNLSEVSVPMALLLLWLGVFGAFIPMAFSYLALRHLAATVVGVIATSETVLAFLFALLWLGEVISTTQALGGIVVIAGILIAQTARQKSIVAKELVDVDN